MIGGIGPRLRQWWADLLTAFWLRPTVMTAAAALLSELLVRTEGALDLPGWLGGWIYAGGVAGARDVLGTIAAATIGVAGTTFSITVAALTLASNQMGPRLLRNFTRDPGNQYALGALLAAFAYALVALRSVHDAEEGAFVPQLAVSVALLLAFACVGVLIWFIHHIATSISVDRVVALVQSDLAAAFAALPLAGEGSAEEKPAGHQWDKGGAPLHAPQGGGYLRVLDEDALADWAADQKAQLRLRVRPGDFVLPSAVIGEVWPEDRQAAAQEAMTRAMTLGDTRSAEQDLEFLVRQLVEIGLRALSPGINDPFTAIAVLDRLGAALCGLASRRLPDGCTLREGCVRLERSATDYAGLTDAMFHMLRQGAAGQPAVIIHLADVLGTVAAVEGDPARRTTLRRHLDLVRETAEGAAYDSSARAALAGRHAAALAALARMPPARPGA